MKKVTSISIVIFLVLTVCAITSCGGRGSSEEEIRVDPRQQGELPEKQTMSSLEDLRKPIEEEYVSEYSNKKPKPSALTWVGLDQALKMSANERSKTKTVIYFSSEAPCEECDTIERHVFTNEEVVKNSERWIFVKVDIDVHRDTAKFYHIDKVPAFKFLDARGFAYRTHIGSVKPDEFAEMLLTWY